MEQVGGAATSMEYLKNPMKELSRGEEAPSYPQPPMSLWVRPISQKTTGRTPRMKNPSTTRLASALIVGQNPIKTPSRV